MTLHILWELYLSGGVAVDAFHQEITQRSISLNVWESFPAAALGNVPNVGRSSGMADHAVAAALLLSSSVAARRAPVCRSTSLAQSVFALSPQETYTKVPRLPSCSSNVSASSSEKPRPIRVFTFPQNPGDSCATIRV